MNQKGSMVVIFLIGCLLLSGVFVGVGFYLRQNGDLLQKNQTNESSNPESHIVTETSSDNIKTNLQSQKLYSIPQNLDQVSAVTFSPDYQHFAYIVTTSSDYNQAEYYVVWDGKEGKHYGNIRHSIIFSPDSKHIAYTAGSKDGKSYVVVKDLEESKAYNAVYFETFTPDSQIFMFKAANGEPLSYKWRIVKNGIEGKIYDDMPDGFIISPDGSKIANHIIKKNGDKRESYYLINDQELGPYDNVVGLTFSPNSQRYSFGYFRESDYSSHLLLDGKEQLAGNGAGFSLFSPDSTKFAYSVNLGDYNNPNWVVVEDGKSSQPNNYKKAIPLAFSSTGILAMSTTDSNNKNRILFYDNKEGTDIEDGLTGAFNPKNDQFAYFKVSGEEYQLYSGNEFIQSYKEYVSNFKFSSDGKHLLVSNIENKQAFISVDKKKFGPYDFVSENIKPIITQSSPSFSPDYSSVIFNTRKGKDLWLQVESY